MAKNITLMGANYPDVPAVQLPQTGGGTATFYDISVVDNLNSTSSTDALSAKQGKVINDMLESNVFTNNVDANNYTTFGFYHVGISSNSPGNVTRFGMLCVFTGGTGFVAQMFIETNNVIYFRYRNNSSSNWLAWQKITSTSA